MCPFAPSSPTLHPRVSDRQVGARTGARRRSATNGAGPRRRSSTKWSRSHLATFLAEARERSPYGAGLLLSVETEFAAYLDCGILARGFARVRCGDCGNELLVGFSC